MRVSRRAFTAGVLALSSLGLSACDVTWDDIKAGIKKLKAFVDAIVPVVDQLDPNDKAKIDAAQKIVDAACDALVALPDGSGTDAKAWAIKLLDAANAILSVALTLPLDPGTKGVIVAVQLILVAIGLFFKLSGAESPGFAALSARAPQYGQAKDKQAALRDAEAKVQAWLDSRPK